MNKLSQRSTINVKNKLLDLTTPLVMGIVNLTEDSFYDGGRYLDLKKALAHADRLLAEGADVLDIGAHSSRPGAQAISAEKELTKLLPFIKELLRRHPEAVLSIDTFRAQVAEACIEAGAAMINDISGGNLDPEMFETAGRLQVPYVLMHMRGTPETMQNLTNYEDLMAEMMRYFSDKINLLHRYGVKDVLLDPGFGFAKNLDQNFQLLNRFGELKVLGYPLLGALSRKSMVYKALQIGPEEALNGTTALHTVLVLKGAAMLRVHDVKAAKEVIKLLEKLKNNA